MSRPVVAPGANTVSTGANTVSTRLWSWAGILFVALFAGGLIGSVAIGTAPFPSPFTDDRTIQTYFTDNHDALVLLTVTQLFAAVVLLLLSAGMAGYVRAVSGPTSALATLTAASGVSAAVFLMLSALLEWVLTRPHVLAGPALVRTLHDLAFVTGGPGVVAGLGVLIGSTAVAALRTHRMPAWFSALGLVVAAVSVASVLVPVATGLVVLLPVGRFAGFLWIIVGSFVASRRP